MVLLLTCELVRHRAHKDIPDVIIHPVVSDLLTVFEGNGSIADAIDRR